MTGTTLRVVQVVVGLVLDAEIKLLLVEVVEMVDARPDARAAAVKLLLVDL